MRSLILGLLLISSHAHASIWFTTDDSQITMQGRIGQRSQAFQLDTGAIHSMLKGEGANLSYPVVGVSTATGVAGQAESCDLVRIPNLATEEFNVSLNSVERCADGFNLFGLDVIGHRVFSLNFSQKKIDFLKAPATAIPNEKHNFMYWTPYGHLALLVGLPGQYGENLPGALFDTGATNTTVDINYVKRLPDVFHPTGRSIEVTDAVGTKQTQSIYRVDRLVIGGREFSNIEVLATDLAPFMTAEHEPANVLTMILGFDIIHQADWVIDLRSPKLGHFSVVPMGQTSWSYEPEK